MVVYIDAGIGQLRASSDNLKLQILLELIKEKIESDGVDKVMDKLSCDDNLNELKEKILDFENDVTEKEERITELEELLEDNSGLEIIDAGIGEINYSTENVLLGMVMENLDAAIQKHNVNKVNEVLSEI